MEIGKVTGSQPSRCHSLKLSTGQHFLSQKRSRAQALGANGEQQTVVVKTKQAHERDRQHGHGDKHFEQSEAASRKCGMRNADCGLLKIPLGPKLRLGTALSPCSALP
jgi:hypothetical protein